MVAIDGIPMENGEGEEKWKEKNTRVPLANRQRRRKVSSMYRGEATNH